MSSPKPTTEDEVLVPTAGALLTSTQQEWHLQKKNLDRYRTSYTCILTPFLLFHLEFVTQRKCRVLGCTSNASE